MTRVTLGDQLRAARALMGFPQTEIARVLRRSVDTVQRAEADHPSARQAARALRDLYTRNGISFIENGVQREPRPVQSASSAQVSTTEGGERGAAARPAPEQRR
jgi:transcriptional regulator with XRE-family HTH domain